MDFSEYAIHGRDHIHDYNKLVELINITRSPSLDKPTNSDYIASYIGYIALLGDDDYIDRIVEVVKNSIDNHYISRSLLDIIKRGVDLYERAEAELDVDISIDYSITDNINNIAYIRGADYIGDMRLELINSYTYYDDIVIKIGILVINNMEDEADNAIVAIDGILDQRDNLSNNEISNLLRSIEFNYIPDIERTRYNLRTGILGDRFQKLSILVDPGDVNSRQEFEEIINILNMSEDLTINQFLSYLDEVLSSDNIPSISTILSHLINDNSVYSTMRVPLILMRSMQ